MAGAEARPVGRIYSIVLYDLGWAARALRRDREVVMEAGPPRHLLSWPSSRPGRNRCRTRKPFTFTLRRPPQAEADLPRPRCGAAVAPRPRARPRPGSEGSQTFPESDRGGRSGTCNAKALAVGDHRRRSAVRPAPPPQRRRVNGLPLLLGCADRARGPDTRTVGQRLLEARTGAISGRICVEDKLQVGRPV